MFSSGPSYNKLKTNLRLSINRLKLLEKKKTELALKSRKEIADYIAQGKAERAKIRVEHIIREDYLVEAMELIEMFCDLLLARFGLIQQGWDSNDLLRPRIKTNQDVYLLYVQNFKISCLRSCFPGTQKH